MELPPSLQDVARLELNETPERRKAALVELREKVLALPPEEKPDRTDDLYLLRFLRPRKFVVNDALVNIRNMEKFKRKNADRIKAIRASDFKEIFEDKSLCVPFRKSHDGHWIVLLYAIHIIKHDYNLPVQFLYWFFEQFADDPFFQVRGIVLVEQFESLTIMDAIQMRRGIPTASWKERFHFMQECMPTRVSGVYILNEPRFFSVLWVFISPFMSSKIRSRVRLFGKRTDKLFELIAPESLPPEYGGKLEESPVKWLEQKMAREPKSQKLVDLKL